MAQHIQRDVQGENTGTAPPDGNLAQDRALASPIRLVLLGIVGTVFLALFFTFSTLNAVQTLDARSLEAEIARAERAVEVTQASVGVIDAAAAISIAEDFLIEGARLADPAALAADELSVAIPGSTDVLAFKPAKLAGQTFRSLAPIRLAVIIAVLSGLGVVFYRLLRLAQALEWQRKRASDLAGRDPLTGLLNRRGLIDALETAFARQGQQAALLYLDLDDFKGVNDTHGHAMGDRLLECVAQRLLTCVDPGDAVARLGGDEFVVLRLSGCSPKQLAAFAHSLHAHVTGPYGLGGTQLEIGLSIGIATRSGKAESPALLVAAADAALYRAKGRADAPFAFSDPAEAQAA
jgi:diguanylate cyclase (GGDEF)-like protein